MSGTGKLYFIVMSLSFLKSKHILIDSSFLSITTSGILEGLLYALMISDFNKFWINSSILVFMCNGYLLGFWEIGSPSVQILCFRTKVCLTSYFDNSKRVLNYLVKLLYASLPIFNILVTFYLCNPPLCSSLPTNSLNSIYFHPNICIISTSPINPGYIALTTITSISFSKLPQLLSFPHIIHVFLKMHQKEYSTFLT